MGTGGKGFLSYAATVILQSVAQRVSLWVRHHRHHRASGRDGLPRAPAFGRGRVSHFEVGTPENLASRAPSGAQILRANPGRPRGPRRCTKTLPDP